MDGRPILGCCFSVLNRLGGSQEDCEANVRFLLTAGANLDNRMMCGSTLMLTACKYLNGTAAAGAPLRCGANVIATDGDGCTALHLVSFWFDGADEPAALLSALLEAGAHVKAVDAEGLTPLHMAMEMDRPHATLVRMLLEAGADSTRADYGGRTAAQHGLQAVPAGEAPPPWLATLQTAEAAWRAAQRH
jgi:hypothetical protein